MKYNDSIQLLPYYEANKNNSIISPRDISGVVDDFNIYVDGNVKI